MREYTIQELENMENSTLTALDLVDEWKTFAYWILFNEWGMEVKDWFRSDYVRYTIDEVLNMSGVSTRDICERELPPDYETDFQIACGNGEIDKVLVLINKVDIFASNNLAYRWAKHNGHTKVLKVLREHATKLKA